MPFQRCSSPPPGPEEPELLAQAAGAGAGGALALAAEVAALLGDAVRSLMAGMHMRMPLRLQEEQVRVARNSVRRQRQTFLGRPPPSSLE